MKVNEYSLVGNSFIVFFELVIIIYASTILLEITIVRSVSNCPFNRIGYEKVKHPRERNKLTWVTAK